MSAPDRRGWLDRDYPELSVRRQCALLGVARSSVYRLINEMRARRLLETKLEFINHASFDVSALLRDQHGQLHGLAVPDR